MCRAPQSEPRYKLSITLEHLHTGTIEHIDPGDQENRIIQTVLDIVDSTPVSLTFDDVSQSNIEDVLFDFGLLWGNQLCAGEAQAQL
jgi:hypothetical protein